MPLLSRYELIRINLGYYYYIMYNIFNTKVTISTEARTDYRIWLSVLLATCLLHLPNILACFIPGFAWFPLKCWLFSMALTLLPCAFGLRVRSMLWIALPLILLVPVCIACLLSLQNLPTTFLILALLETNQTELSAFLPQALWTGLGTLFLTALYVWIVKKRVPSDFRFGPFARVIIVSTLCVPLLGDLIGNPPTVCLASLKLRCLSTFPCSTFYGTYEALDMRGRVQNRQALSEKLEVHQAPEFRNDPNRQVHMLVIGESATKSCFGLYGYERETTPLLERTPGLLPFRDVTSTATVTLLAVPAMITASAPGKVLEATQQTSLLLAYRKAGFRVYWLSAQKKHGTFDTLTSIFSEDAHEAVFKGGKFDAGGVGAYGGSSDLSLLPLVREVLQRNEPKVLFVLHTIGSHAPYPSRCPTKIARFPADKQDVVNALMRMSATTASNPQDLQLIQNSYDNTICATDILLANLINDLRQIKASSWLCYISDHGENTSKALLGKFMHGMVTRQVVEIPMLMWLSPLYAQTHLAKANNLKANLDTSFSASCTFHTLLDLGGLSCDGFKQEWSSASPQFTPGPRLVCDSNGKITDYDKKFSPLQVSSKPPLKQVSANNQSMLIGAQ